MRAQILHSVDTDLKAQEGRKLFVETRHEALPIDAQHMMPVIDFFQQRLATPADRPQTDRNRSVAPRTHRR
jgi:hypothetical protein